MYSGTFAGMRGAVTYLLFVWCLVLAPSVVWCQLPLAGAIKGHVVDKDTRQPLTGAIVAILPAGPGTTTDTLGHFLLPHVTVGSVSIQVSLIGYETQTINDVSVLPQKTAFREVSLQPAITTLGAFQVKSFRFENSRTTPVSSFSFSREEINLNPGAQGDIFRAISMLPGVSGSGGIYSAISVRGQGVRDNVYMVDDIPVTEVGHLEGNSFFNDPNGGRFSIFAPRVVESAQFQAGGFGPGFGRRSASALSLAIREGNQQNAIVDGQVDLLGVTLNYDGPTGALKKTNLFLSARYQNFYGLVNLLGLKDIGLPTYGDVIAKTTTQINARNQLSLLLVISPERYVRDINNVYADKKLNLLYLPDFRRNKIIAGINLKTLTGTKSYWRNILYATTYTSDVQVGKAYPDADTQAKLINPFIPFNTRLQTQDYAEKKIGYRSLYNVSLGRNTKLEAGVEADVLQLQNTRTLYANDTNYVFRLADLPDTSRLYQPVFPAQVNASYNGTSLNASAYLNYSVVFGNNLSVNAGLRYDYTGLTQQHTLAPRISGSYFISERHSINFGYGIYIQDPVYADVADQPSGNTLKNEEVTQYILSYRWHIRPDVKFTVEGWYKSFSHLLVTPVNGTVLKNNDGTGWGNGFDVNFTKRLVKQLHGQVSYSYIQTKRDDHDGFGSYNFMFSQPHQFNVMISHKYSRHWIFALKYRYATGKPKDSYIIHQNVLNDPSYIRYSKEIVGRNELRLPDFSSLDIRANYVFPFRKATLTIFFDIVNVLNKQIANSENFNPITGQNYFDGLAIFPTGGLKFEF